MRARLSISPAVMVAILLAALSGAGCLGSVPFKVVDAHFNERFTLDRRSLANSQQGEDPTAGPFRNDAGQVASYSMPLFAGSERLLQSDCLWLGNDAGAGDDLLLNWEAVIVLDRKMHNDLALAEGDQDLSACRLNDPVTRQPPLLVEDDVLDPEHVMMVVHSVDLPNFAFRAGDEPGEALIEVDHDISFEEGFEFLAARLVEVPSAAANPDRRCDDFNQTGMEREIVSGVLGYDANSSPDNRVALCSGLGRRVRPERDARLEVQLVDNNVPFAAQDFGGVMVAGSGERLRRPLGILADGRVQWQTPHGGGRWHENFSSTLRVQEVRLLRRTASGDQYLSADQLAGETLCVRPSASASSCLWTCPVATAGDGAAVFRPADGQCQRSDGGVFAARLTPTYDVGVLEQATSAIDQPLAWRFSPELPSDLWVEFRLVTDFAPIAVRTDALTDFGAISPGVRRDDYITVRNVGYRSVRIDNLGFDPSSAHPGDFGYIALTDPVAVPVPIEQVDEEEGPVLGLAEGFAGFPALEFGGGMDQRLALARPANLSGHTFEINGEPLTFDGPLALTARADADFQPSVVAGSKPALARPLNRVAHFPRPLPFMLAPGDSFRVALYTQLSAYGDREARLRIDYSDPVDPSGGGHVQSVGTAYGMQGPLPGVLPDTLIFSDLHGGTQRVRNALVVNAGDLPLEVHQIEFHGDDAQQFQLAVPPALPLMIQSAASSVLGVEYLDTCPAPGGSESHSGQLLLVTNAGEFEIGLRGWSTDC